MSDWTPNLADRAEVKGLGRLIPKIYEILSEKADVLNAYKDKAGVYAIETQEAIVTCKKSVYVNTVSCHDPAVTIAEEKEKSLVMYVEENSDGSELDTFYEFDVDQVKNVGRVNIREVEGVNNSDVPMQNFPISIGEPVTPEEL